MFDHVELPPPLPDGRDDDREADTPPPTPHGEDSAGVGTTTDDPLAGYNRRHSQDSTGAKPGRAGAVGDVDWKSRWLTYAVVTFLFVPAGIVWGLVYATYHKKRGSWVPAPAWSKWTMPVVALFVAIPLFYGGLVGIERGLVECDVSSNPQTLLLTSWKENFRIQ